MVVVVAVVIQPWATWSNVGAQGGLIKIWLNNKKKKKKKKKKKSTITGRKVSAYKHGRSVASCVLFYL